VLHFPSGPIVREEGEGAGGMAVDGEVARADGVRPIGVLHGCALEVLADSLWQVDADLAVAGVYEHDTEPGVLGGLERVLGGLAALRSAELLKGTLGDTLLLSRPPAPIRAGAVLIVGLGDESSVTAESVRRAATVTADQVVRMQVGHVASAWGRGDGVGISDGALPHLSAVVGGIESVLGTTTHRVHRWSFLTVAKDLDQFAERFRTAFALASHQGRYQLKDDRAS